MLALMDKIQAQEIIYRRDSGEVFRSTRKNPEPRKIRIEDPLIRQLG